MFTLDIKSLFRNPTFNKNSLHTQLTEIIGRAGVSEGDFVIEVTRRTTMRRENPVLRIDATSSVAYLRFATWLKDERGNKHFIECGLFSKTTRKHGLIEKMRALATELNQEAEQALPLLQKSLATDSAMLKRIITRMRETKRRIRDMGGE